MPLPRRRPRQGSFSSQPSPAGGGPRVLFLGSSLTYANDMPYVLQAMARAMGQSLDVTVIARGGASLEDHWKQGEAVRRLRAETWQYVVLQQGPSSLAASRENLREYTGKFAEPIRKAGARPVLYMVWPSADRFAYFDVVRGSYELAAEDVGGMLCPAGEAFREVWKRDPKVPLLRRDGTHPSPTGSFTIALSLFGMLLSRSPVGIPAHLRLRNGAHAQVPAEVAPLLQEAAAEANERYGRR